MKKLLLSVVTALALPAMAGEVSTSTRADAGFRERLYQRYCDKLRESPIAYTQFVRRLKPVHGFTYSDFAPEYTGAPVIADCKVSRERIAELYKLLAASPG